MLETLFSQFDSLLVLDTETTGINCRTDEIIELAVLQLTQEGGALRREEMDEFIRLSPGRHLPAMITNLTGITEQMLADDGLEKPVVAERFAEMLRAGRTLIVAYNAQFDLCFLYFFLRAHGMADALRGVKMLDAMTVYKDRRPYPHKLANAVEAYRLQTQNTHRAIDDATATFELLEAMEAECADLERYINLFGYNPRFGAPKPAIGSITYKPQGYDRSGKLYRGRAHVCVNDELGKAPPLEGPFLRSGVVGEGSEGGGVEKDEVRTVPAEEPLVPEPAKQARERAAVHAELTGHLFPGNGEREVRSALRAEKIGETAAAIRNGEALDTALQAPVFLRDLAEQIFQKMRTVFAAARRAEREQRGEREEEDAAIGGGTQLDRAADGLRGHQHVAEDAARFVHRGKVGMAGGGIVPRLDAAREDDPSLRHLFAHPPEDAAARKLRHRGPQRRAECAEGLLGKAAEEVRAGQNLKILG